MKLIIVFASTILLLLMSSCVQKSYKKTVVFTLDVSEIKNIQKVGIQGNDKPLSWNYNTEMKAIKKDSLYQIIVSGETGYKFTEVKFVVNDNFELINKDNRRIYFNEKKDTTFYNAKFNQK